MGGRSFLTPKKYQELYNLSIYLIGMIPAIWYFYLGAVGDLGADPVKTFEQALGLWALRFLVLTLAVSPLRHVFGWNFVRYRRAFGLLSFYYALMHLAVYLFLDQAMNVPVLWDDILKRPFIMFGMISLILLVPLALTSSNYAIRKMGRRWSRLHQLIYVVAILILFHFYLSAKILSFNHYIYIVLITLLLLYRVGLFVIKKRHV